MLQGYGWIAYVGTNNIARSDLACSCMQYFQKVKSVSNEVIIVTASHNS